MIRPSSLVSAAVLVPLLLALCAPRAAVAEDTYESLSKEWSEAEASYWAKMEALESQTGEPGPETKPASPPKYPYDEFAVRFKGLAIKAIKTDQSLAPLFWLIVNCNPTPRPIAPPPPAKWAIDYLASDFGGNPAIKDYAREMQLATLAVGVKPMEHFLNTVGMLSRDKESQAAAVYAMGYGMWMNDVVGVDANGKMIDDPETRRRATNVFRNCATMFPGTKGGDAAKAFMFEIEHLQAEMPAPDFAGKDAEGKEFTLSGLKGRVVVLKFWRFTCPDCRKRIPQERELVEQFKDKPFTLLGVATDESPGAFKKLLDENKINWPNIYDGKRGEGAIHKQWNIVRVPTVYVIDKAGVIRYRDLHGTALEKAVEKLLEK